MGETIRVYTQKGKKKNKPKNTTPNKQNPQCKMISVPFLRKLSLLFKEYFIFQLQCPGLLASGKLKCKGTLDTLLICEICAYICAYFCSLDLNTTLNIFQFLATFVLSVMVWITLQLSDYSVPVLTICMLSIMQHHLISKV